MGTQDQIWTRHRVAVMRLTTDGRAKPVQGVSFSPDVRVQ